MVLAKPLSSKPRDVASKLVEQLAPRLGAVCEPPEIAGPGFINLKLKDDFVAERLGGMIADKTRLGIPRCVRDLREACFVGNPGERCALSP